MTVSAISLLQATQLPNSLTSEYTVPSNSKVVVRHAVFTNTTAGAVTVTAEIVPNGGSTGNAAKVMDGLSISANTAYVSPELSGVVLNAGDQIYLSASTVSAISANISGLLQT